MFVFGFLSGHCVPVWMSVCVWSLIYLYCGQDSMHRAMSSQVSLYYVCMHMFVCLYLCVLHYLFTTISVYTSVCICGVSMYLYCEYRPILRVCQWISRNMTVSVGVSGLYVYVSKYVCVPMSVVYVGLCQWNYVCAWVLCNRGRTEKLLLVRTILLNYSILLSSKSFRKHIVKDLAAKQNYPDTFKHQTDNKTLFLPIFNYLFFLGSGPGIRSLLGPSVDSNIKPDFRTKEKAEILHRKLQCTSTTCVFTYVTVEQKRVFKSHVEKDQRSPFLLRGDVHHQPGASETTISN